MKPPKSRRFHQDWELRPRPGEGADAEELERFRQDSVLWERSLILGDTVSEAKERTRIFKRLQSRGAIRLKTPGLRSTLA